jgi:hypothetical protein
MEMVSAKAVTSSVVEYHNLLATGQNRYCRAFFRPMLTAVAKGPAAPNAYFVAYVEIWGCRLRKSGC